MISDDLPPLAEGDVLAEKYRVERVLGVGGVGVVVSATHVTLGQRVALKFLRRSAAEDPDAVERFLREARAVVRLKSQHSIRVLDVGTLDTGVPYMVMELLDGSDFADILEKRGRLPVTEAVAYVLQACEALAEAHAAGVVHRDLKPENLFMTKGVDHRPLVKVLDFGLVKEMNQPTGGDTGRSLTGALAMGTPAYMSPEQIKSTRDVDPRTDIWSMGAVLYELLSGRLPFEAQSLPELIAAIVRDPPRPLGEIAPHVPEGLVAVVARCLEKNPADRYPKIAKLAAALDEFSGDADSLGTGARLKLVQPSLAPSATPDAAWLPAPYDPVALAATDRRAAAATLSRVTWTDPLPTARKRAASLWALSLLAFCGVGAALLYVFARATPLISPATPSVISTASAVGAESSPRSDTSTAPRASTGAPPLSPLPSTAASVPSPSSAPQPIKPSTVVPKKPPHVTKDTHVPDDRLLETR